MKRLSVFLAEDNEADVFIVQESFNTRSIEYELLLAEDGEAAGRMIDEFGKERPCPDIILLDLNLPKMEGGELLERIRQHDHCSQVPVLVVSSSNSPRDQELIKQFGARYFRKPSDLDNYLVLADVVMEMVDSEAS